MDDTQKMLRVVINGQSSMKSELLGEINKLRKETRKGFEDQKKESSETEKRLTHRLDLIGKQVAYLDDDAPTGEEHKELKERVTKLEHKVATL